MNYLERNRALVVELNSGVQNGLIFERKNISIKRGAYRRSTVGVYHSQILDRNIHVGLDELKASNPLLRAAINLEYAERLVNTHGSYLDELPAFYAVLTNKAGKQIGMIYEDLSEGGGRELIEPNRFINDKIEVTPNGYVLDDTLKINQTTWLGVSVDGEFRIFDFSPEVKNLAQDKAVIPGTSIPKIIENEKFYTVYINKPIKK